MYMSNIQFVTEGENELIAITDSFPFNNDYFQCWRLIRLFTSMGDLSEFEGNPKLGKVNISINMIIKINFKYKNLSI